MTEATDIFNIELNDTELRAKSILSLAYVGDGVYELMVRTRLCMDSEAGNNRLHQAALRYVSAEGQYQAYSFISGMLTEEEHAVWIRGRNAHVKSVPHNADRAKYQTATGLEALFGWLWLGGRKERLCQLFEVISQGFPLAI